MIDVSKHVRPVLCAVAILAAIGIGTIPKMTHGSPIKSDDSQVPSNGLATDTALSTAFDRPDTCKGFDPIKRYGPELKFQIRRNDAPVGVHSVTFNRGRDGLQVVAQSNIDISILGFNAYRFAYRSESIWQGNRLMRLSVNVDDDGERTDVTATRESNHLVVNGPGGRQVIPTDIFPTDHWHCGVLARKSVLNTITGKPNDVTITAGRSEMLRTMDGSIRATGFRYNGELKTDAWYDHLGRWVGLQFRARDGSTITYRCMNCQTRNAAKEQG